MADATVVPTATPAPTSPAAAKPAAGEPVAAAPDAQATQVAEAAANATPTERAAFDAHLKASPMVIKAGGKQHKITSLAQFERYAQRGIPVEENMAQLSKARAEIEPKAALLQRLRSGNQEEVESVLEQLVDSGQLTAIAERRLLRQLEQEKQTEGMSERERRMAAQLEQAQAEKQRYESEAKQRKEAETKYQERQQEEHYRTQISTSLVQALEILGLPPELSPEAIDRVRPYIKASIENGMELDPKVMAEKLDKFFSKNLEWQTSKLEGDALLKKMGPDFANRFRKAILAQLQTKPAPKPGQPQQTQPTSAPMRWDPRSMR